MIDFKRIFFDTSPVIYWMESNFYYWKAIDLFLEMHRNSRFVMSTITMMEYLVFPYRTNNQDLVDKFYEFIADMDFLVVPASEDIAVEAAKIRARFGAFKSMDALQLAAAKCSACDLFFTNDKQLKQFSDFECLTIEEYKNRMNLE